MRRGVGRSRRDEGVKFMNFVGEKCSKCFREGGLWD